ncbi:MAG: hypothetical protein PQJ46_14390 [Spirochaetales bacterium]|nr:hypothetical protein [Spirochaetales bacterium]
MKNIIGIIRRFIPKGSGLGNIELSGICKIQNWMNTYPRKILGGDKLLEASCKQMGTIFKISAFWEVAT